METRMDEPGVGARYAVVCQDLALFRGTGWLGSLQNYRTRDSGTD